MHRERVFRIRIAVEEINPDNTAKLCSTTTHLAGMFGPTSQDISNFSKPYLPFGSRQISTTEFYGFKEPKPKLLCEDSYPL